MENRKQRIEDQKERIEDKVEDVATNSHGTQATKTEIISETGHEAGYEDMRTDKTEDGEVKQGFVDDEETAQDNLYENMRADKAEEGVVNQGFVDDEKKAADEEEAVADAVAAVAAAVEEDESVGTEALHQNNNNITVVAADVTQDSNDAERGPIA